ncbi:hypothetical protein AcV7_009861 [Taiwanofungus camphoratus]|nr:hypothetical protein AcV7_009861 [Antrodia cinnamomea]
MKAFMVIVAALIESVQPTLSSCRETTAALAELTPPNQFWRWKDMWSTSLRKAVFSAALIEYLRSGVLLSLSQASEMLGSMTCPLLHTGVTTDGFPCLFYVVEDDWHDRFVLTAEDYLHALISLVNELSRLAVNAVTLGDYEQPIKISIFVKDLFAGFSMLNLKNDTLRRRYDSLKYDIKKIEEGE